MLSLSPAAENNYAKQLQQHQQRTISSSSTPPTIPNSPMPKNKKSKKSLDPSSTNPNPNEIMEEEASPSQEQQLPLVSPRRKPSTKPKKKPIPKKKLAVINEKLSFLSKNLRPVHSLPSPKTLADFVLPHEPLFRSLGLWDFAHLTFSDPLRRGLLAELIARFDPCDRCSYVRD